MYDIHRQGNNMDPCFKHSIYKIIKNEAGQWTSDRVGFRMILYLLFFSPEFQLNILYRINRKIYLKFDRFGITRYISKIIMNFTRLLTGGLIDEKAEIGESFFIAHSQGVIIGSRVKIGNNVTIYNDLNIGNAQLRAAKTIPMPEIGDNVVIGAGARLLGPIKIGNNVMIGANAVVLKSFGPNVTIAGVPARVVRVHDEEKLGE